MRLQVLVHAEKVSVWLRVGKPEGSIVDREALKEKLKSNPTERQRFFNLVKKLPAHYFLTVHGEDRDVNSFNDPDDLAGFVLKDIAERYYFIIGTEYRADDKLISETRIVDTVMRDYSLLYPLYLYLRTPAP